ncbi:MAG TPA: hypothetical protein PLD25_13550 [Chloroflexota bacterium]|nr:hypothetical protein [Chloroflexota bacterium]HUM71430.1 hypothetical protein [Chloroflexota bacterium]
MIVKRSGAKRNAGSIPIIKNKDFKATWRKSEAVAVLTIKGVSDPNATYNYDFMFSLEELGKLLDLISVQALEDSPDLVAEKLAPHSRALLRLLFASGGISNISQSGR